MKTLNSIRSLAAPLAGTLLLAGVACLFVSCASVNATTTQYVGVTHYPPSNPANVAILRSEPTQPFERLGEIMLDSSTDPAPPVTEIEQKLRTEAAKIGADAAVVVYDRVQPMGVFISGGYWNRTASTVTGHRLVGLAIKYR